eukprot:1067075-Prorocentrum_lima.AAC.1
MHLRAYVSRSQHGYGYRAGTSETLLTTRMWVDVCNQRSHSWGLLCLDVSSAFTNAEHHCLARADVEL